MERHIFSILAGSLVFALVFGCNMAMAEADDQLQGMEISVATAELAVGGNPIHLYGVHFPPESGLCGEQAGDCRAQALMALEEWISDRSEVRCQVLAVAASGTHFVECRQGEDEIGGWLVANGLALADRQVSRRYIREEQAARRAGVGLWERFGTQFSMAR